MLAVAGVVLAARAVASARLLLVTVLQSAHTSERARATGYTGDTEYTCRRVSDIVDYTLRHRPFIDHHGIRRKRRGSEKRGKEKERERERHGGRATCLVSVLRRSISYLNDIDDNRDERGILRSSPPPPSPRDIDRAKRRDWQIALRIFREEFASKSR